MKNSKFAKLLILALSLMLLIGSAVGIAVSAEGENTYDIAKISVAHGDRTYVLMAVDVPVAEASGVEVSYSYGGESFTAEYDGTSTVTIAEVTYPVFYTHGISPKDIGEDIIADAHAKGATDYTAKSVNVSIAEYLYNMLYAQNYVNATEAEDINLKTLYEAHLAYGAAAQQALWNDKGNEARTLVTERSYVYSAYATINESGARELLLPAKTGEVTLTKNSSYPSDAIGWTVTTYTADGTATVTEYKNTDTVSISGHSVITPLEQRVINFEKSEVGAVTGIDGLTAKAIDAESSVAVAVDPKNENNKALLLDANGNNTQWDGGNILTEVIAAELDEDANCYVFEMDVLFTNAATTHNSTVQISFTNSAGEAFTGLALQQTKNSDLTIQKMTTTGAFSGTIVSGKASGVWAKLRLEYYIGEGKMKIWYNGQFIDSTTLGVTGKDNTSFEKIKIYTTGECCMDIYLDNIVCEAIVKEYQ